MISTQRDSLVQGKVKIISVKGPTRIYVRPVDWNKDYVELKNQLELHFTLNNNGGDYLRPKQGDVICALWNRHWHRALVLGHQRGQETDVIVRLLDIGHTINVSADEVRECPPHLMVMTARVICCHLDGVMFGAELMTEDKLLDIISHLPESRIVEVIKKGPPVYKQFEDDGVQYNLYSLPVDLTWQHSLSEEPFLPETTSFHSLTELFHKCLGVETTNPLDDTINLLSEDEANSKQPVEKEFEYVLPMTRRDSSFQWLAPELPGKHKFSARGIYVDPSGQIYIQPNQQRHTVGVLRHLLNEKLRDSPPDDEESPMKEGQSCCVRWRNGSWYRGRFLRYTSATRSTALIYLVDWGDVHEAEVTDEVRRTIFAERVPIQALRVELAGVTPVGADNTWSPTCLDMMQELINYEQGKKIKVEIVGDSRTLPLQVKIRIPLSDGSRQDLAGMLAMNKMMKVKLEHNSNPSALFLELRSGLETGIQAVPHGHYPDTNVYALINSGEEDLDELLHPVTDNSVDHINWSRAGLKVGDVLRAEYVELGTSPNIVYLHAADKRNKYLSKMVNDYHEIFVRVQAEVESNPPVFQPKVGLLVCVHYKQLGWYRAEIISYSETTITVRFIDFGNTETIRDSLKVREMPAVFAKLPMITITLTLDIECLEEDDILRCLMMESLLSFEDDVGIKITGFKEKGGLSGHLVNFKNNELLYSGLTKEGLININ